MLKDSVINGPYKFKSKITAKDTDGVTDIRREERLEDLKGDDKLCYDSDIKAINILFLGFPVDIYTLINHYQTTKKIWDRVKELMKGTELPPLQSYAPPIVQQPPTFQPDTRLAIPTFLPTDDPIASLNTAMIFLSSVYRSKFPPTNNQLRTLSNPRTQVTIQNDQVMVQNGQGRKSQGYADNVRNNQALGTRIINAVGNTWANQPRGKDSKWFKDKMLLAQAQETRVVLDEEKQDFLADSLEETDDYCDNEATSNAIFMANLSPVSSLNDDTVAPRYDSEALFEEPHYETYHDSDMLNSNIQELGYIENIVSTNESYDALKGNSDVIFYTDYMLTIGDDADNYVLPPRRTMLSPHEIGSWEQSDIKCAFKKDVISFSKNLKETFKLFEKGFIAEVKEMKDIFEQMEDEVDQCFMAKKSFETEKKQLLINTDRLLEENIASDIMCTYLCLLNEVDNCGKCKSLEIVLLHL
ncbi:hypothetical protein Tco_0366601 [Tanacetum coccineum]